MSRQAIPAYDHNNMTHWFIWHVMADELTDEDFEAIQLTLIEREDDLKAIEDSSVMYVPFDSEHRMIQPRRVDEDVKAQARHYVNWSTAQDICMILSKYAKFYSKL